MSDSLVKKLESYLDRAESMHLDYSGAEPYPHIVIDDFLPYELAEEIYSQFPQKGHDLWNALPTDDQKSKFVTNDVAHFPEVIRNTIYHLNAKNTLHFLEEITGIENLISDAKLSGGGLHRIERGGKLSVHVDFSHHHENKLNRRLNLLIYLNKDWKEEYGGHFEFWDAAGKDRKKLLRVAPKFNRCVIFSTSPESYHGHPEPLNCPANLARQSIALYYFTNGRDDGKEEEHNTLFKSSGEERVSLTTKAVRFASSGLFRDITPPFLYRFLKNLWNKGS